MKVRSHTSVTGFVFDALFACFKSLTRKWRGQNATSKMAPN